MRTTSPTRRAVLAVGALLVVPTCSLGLFVWFGAPAHGEAMLGETSRSKAASPPMEPDDVEPPDEPVPSDAGKSRRSQQISACCAGIRSLRLSAPPQEVGIYRATESICQGLVDAPDEAEALAVIRSVLAEVKVPATCDQPNQPSGSDESLIDSP